MDYILYVIIDIQIFIFKTFIRALLRKTLEPFAAIFLQTKPFDLTHDSL